MRSTHFALACAFGLLFLTSLKVPAATHYNWGTVTYGTHGLQGDLWGPTATPLGSYPGVVMVHGGGFVTGTRSWNTSISQWLADNGFVVFNIDYRLAPTYVYPAPETDVKQAAQYLAGLPYVSTVSVFGTSAGAVLAEEFATYGPGYGFTFAKAVAWSGMGDYDETDGGPNDHLGCFPAPGSSACPMKYELAESISHIDSTDSPIYVAHSVSDPNIAAWTDEDFMSAYLAPHTFYEPAGTAHGTNFFQDDTAKAGTIAFLNS